MKYLLLILFIHSFSFSQDTNLSSIFVTNKNQFQYYDIDFYDELDSYLPIETTNIITNELPVSNTENSNALSTTNQHKNIKQITPVPKQIYNISNYIHINQFFVDIQAGNNYAITTALKNGMHPDVRSVENIKDGMTPLLMATSYRRNLVIKNLLHEGANPNLSTHKLGISNITPLMIAAQQGPLETVEYLINYGADINAKTEGITAGNSSLMVAVRNQHEDIVQYLLTKSADVNIATTSGRITNVNALMIASQTGNDNIVKLLAQSSNINLHAVDSEGKNALVYAYLSGNMQIITYLISLGVTTTFTPSELQNLVKETLSS